MALSGSPYFGMELFKESDLPDKDEYDYVGTEKFETIFDAMKKEEIIEIEYTDSNGQDTKREIFPEVIFRLDYAVYVAAYCFLRNEYRTFNFFRIKSVTKTDKKDKSHGIAEEYREKGVPWQREEKPEKKVITPEAERNLSISFRNCVEFNYIEGMVHYLERGADINYTDIGCPALIRAVQKGCHKAVRFMVNRGADVEIKNFDGGTTPLIAAIGRNDKILIKYFVEHCYCNVNSSDNWGQTPLYYAVRKNDFELIKYFLAHGADINYKLHGKQHMSLFRACMLSQNTSDENIIKMMKFLVACGANVNYRESYGRTPLCYAIAAKNRHFVKFLLDEGAMINARDGSSNTPLHALFFISLEDENKDYDGIFDILELLFDYGADINAVNSSGQTPLMLARGKKCADFLIAHGAISHKR